MSVAWFAPLLDGSQAPWPEASAVLYQVAFGKPTWPWLDTSVRTMRAPMLPTTFTEPRFASGPPKRSIRYAALLFSFTLRISAGTKQPWPGTFAARSHSGFHAFCGLFVLRLA